LSPTRTAIAVPIVLGVWCAGFIVPELHIALLYLTPGLLLALALLAGRYPGERVLRELTNLAIRVARRPVQRAVVKRSYDGARCPHGGLLIAAGLAGRAPPQTKAYLTVPARPCKVA
jgi:hypothetical protein